MLDIYSIVLKLDEMGITQKEMAEKAGLAPNTIGAVLSGKKKPQFKTELKIKKFMSEVEYVKEMFL